MVLKEDKNNRAGDKLVPTHQMTQSCKSTMTHTSEVDSGDKDKLKSSSTVMDVIRCKVKVEYQIDSVIKEIHPANIGCRVSEEDLGDKDGENRSYHAA
ncbi:hypothetical protein NL676_014340 [Syzygium grande]|nr:hypothetical protein NL676_014340 [Syzygium grande]